MRAVLLVFLAVLQLPVVALGQTAIRKSVIGAGGAYASQGGTAVSSVIGDVMAGHTASGPIVTWHGFYAPVMRFTDVADPFALLETSFGRVSPNPARSSATIEFGLGAPRVIEICLYDVSGRLVRTLRPGELAVGVSRIHWDLRSDRGEPVPSGVYFIQVRPPDSRPGRLVVIR